MTTGTAEARIERRGERRRNRAAAQPSCATCRRPTNVVDYAARLVRATRPAGEEAPEFVRKWVRWGAGPRAGQALLLGGEGARAARGAHRSWTSRTSSAVALPVLAPPRPRELPGRSRRHRRRRNRPAAARRRRRAEERDRRCSTRRVLAAIADLELVSRRVVDGTISGAASQSLSRLQRRVQPVPALPAGRRSEVRRLEALRAHRPALHRSSFARRPTCCARSRSTRARRWTTRERRRRQQISTMRGCSLARSRTCSSRQGDAVGPGDVRRRHWHYLPSRGGQTHLRASWSSRARDAGGRDARRAGAWTDDRSAAPPRTHCRGVGSLRRRRGRRAGAATRRARRSRGRRLPRPDARRNRAPVQWRRGARRSRDGPLGAREQNRERPPVSRGDRGVPRSMAEPLRGVWDRLRAVLTDTPLDEALRGYLRRRAARLVT